MRNEHDLYLQISRKTIAKDVTVEEMVEVARVLLSLLQELSPQFGRGSPVAIFTQNWQ